jgi:4-alpha-glucanotransferase
MAESRVTFERSSNLNDAVDRAAAEQRIDSGYWDIFHRYNQTSRDVHSRLLAAMGWDVATQESIDAEREKRFRAEFVALAPATRVLSESDRSIPVTVSAAYQQQRFEYQFTFENGDSESGAFEFDSLPFWREISINNEIWICRRFAIPATAPLGYHRLHLSARHFGQTADATVILCPDRAYLPDTLRDGLRSAGFNVTLYGLRSARNWGCGDFTDLRNIARWAHDEVGFSFIGVNPLHALHNRVPYNTSPYLPLSIYYKNLIYIDIEAVPEFTACNLAQKIFHAPKLQDELARLRSSEIVCYQDVDRLKRRFLKMLFREFRHSTARRVAFKQ